MMSCFDKTANGWLHKGIMIQGHKMQVVFELTAAYAPEKGTANHSDAGQLLFSSRDSPRVIEGYGSDGV